MFNLLWILVLIGCETVEQRDWQAELDSIRLQMSSLETSQDVTDEKIEGLEGMCAINRQDLSALQKAVRPIPPKKKKKGKK